MVKILRPLSLQEALAFKVETKALAFSGGTDLMVRRRGYTGTCANFTESVLFLDAVKELQYIKIENDTLNIGSAVTLSELLDFKYLPELFVKSFSEIAAVGLRNRATLAGNICNASPAGDSIPPLYIHNATFTLQSSTNNRQVSLEKFYLGPGKTCINDNEILTEISIPLLPEKEHYYYRKVGTRKAIISCRICL